MIERITSGNDALNSVLGGGFPRNSINVLMGLPGTGKTILGEQVVFSNATPESPALYISTISEPLDKMLRYVQGFDYFDPSFIDDAVFYADLSDTLRTEGLSGFVDRATELIKEHAPSVVVIDSFKALHLFSDDGKDTRHRLSELLSMLSSLATTSFLVGEYSSQEISALSEFAVADGIVELVLQKHGVRDARYLRVVKQRGSDFLGGEHAFRISSVGIELFPRLVTPVTPISYELVSERIKTGVDLLDEMVSEGFWRGSSTVVFGPPGCGKTLLGLHYIFKGIEAGEKGIIATMQENPSQLQRIVSGFGWDLQRAVDEGLLEVLYVSPVNMYIDEFMDTIRRGAADGVARVMIDSLTDLEVAAPDPGRFRDYIYALVQSLPTLGVSTYMTSEVRDLFATSVRTEFGISHMSDNVVLLHYVRRESEIQRAISVLKTRGSHHDPRIRQFTISSDGMHIGEPFPDGTGFPRTGP